MKPLIDADILVYEVGASGQYYEEDDVKREHPIMRSFDKVAEHLDQKVKEICALVWATEEPVMFLSMTAQAKKRHAKKLQKQIKRLEAKEHTYVLGEEAAREEEIRELKEAQVYKPNFREGIAKKKEYKVCRKKSVRPLHYDNLVEYILATYNCVMAEGLEADDLLSVHQCAAEPLTTIICTRDKDLRQVPGMHFGWECGKQAQFGPERVNDVGRLYFIYRGVNAKGEPKLDEVKGTGGKFFCAQLITGDTVDSIPGLPGAGVVAVFKNLKDVESVEEGLLAVKALYVKKFGDGWKAELLEQGRLLFMTVELNEDGSPILWEIPECLD